MDPAEHFFGGGVIFLLDGSGVWLCSLWGRDVDRRAQPIFRGRYSAFRGRQGGVFQDHGICFGGGAVPFVVRYDTFGRAA